MNELTIIMYHYVRNIKNSPYKNIKGLETDGFKRQLDYLIEYYNISLVLYFGLISKTAITKCYTDYLNY